jgi:hypothetical protein
MLIVCRAEAWRTKPLQPELLRGDAGRGETHRDSVTWDSPKGLVAQKVTAVVRLQDLAFDCILASAGSRRTTGPRDLSIGQVLAEGCRS